MNKPAVADIADIMKYAGNSKVAETTLNMPHPYLEEHAIYWINMANEGFVNRDQFVFAVRLAGSAQLIGGIGLNLESRFDRAEMGYWIAEPFWGNGYASEATKAVVKFGFEQLKLNKIYATHFSGNLASGKVMRNCGMTKEAELSEHIKKGGKYFDLVQYGLTKNVYTSS
ncbi:GNAT family N-acetyltransferase [Fulvivirga sp. M361]|uniref:GNAT family N-acetyltransferase n=1 Tax=Fulvivirga sp. M361 TaxID=2594266 RepID=UPI001C876624|nr:GNAT family protein [Fulvivirga sp. M361]